MQKNAQIVNAQTPTGPVSSAACIVYRCDDKEIEYLIVTPKPKEGEPYEYRFPLGQKPGRYPEDAALVVAREETGYAVEVGRRVAEMNFHSGDAPPMPVFVVRPEGPGMPSPRVKGMTAKWHCFEDAMDLVKYSMGHKDPLNAADEHLRSIVPGPLVRKNTDAALKPIIKRLMDLCGPAWAVFEGICHNPKGNDVEYCDVNPSDFEPFMAVYAVRVALRAYFQRTLYLVDSQTLCVVKSKADTRDLVLDRLGTTWSRLADDAERRFPLAAEALHTLSQSARAMDQGFFGACRPEPGSALAHELRGLLSVHQYSYAMEDRLRMIVAMSANGMVVARGLSQCPELFNQAVAVKTLLEGKALPPGGNLLPARR